MSKAVHQPNSATAEGDWLQARIDDMVRRFEDLKDEPGSYASIVDLALKEKERQGTLDLKDFGRRLRRAGLPGPRASEVTAILAAPDVARQFAAAGGWSVRKAIAAARAERRPRGEGRKPEENPPPKTTPKPPPHQGLQNALDRLLGIMGSEQTWNLKQGIYLLRFSPSPSRQA